MKIISIGSLNVDHVYKVPHFSRPGETLPSSAYQKFPGGKGLNQSVALARAGALVYHAGKIGEDGLWLKNFLEQNGVRTDLLQLCDKPTGHAIIQVVPTGENSIILEGGANQDISEENIIEFCKGAEKGDLLLLQNEISNLSTAIEHGYKAGLKVALNPAPFTKSIHSLPLDLISYLILNEVEAAEFVGESTIPEMLNVVRSRFPNACTLLTAGREGVFSWVNNELLHVAAETVHAVDTTAAGDTFIGFFLASIAKGQSISEAMRNASKAAAICVTRQGAAVSIPWQREIANLAA